MTYAIIRADIKALKNADYLTFNGDVIQASKEPTGAQPYVMTRGIRLANDGRDRGFIYSAPNTAHMRSIFRLLKTGDSLNLRTHRGAATTPAMREHDFHGDVLTLNVYRDGSLAASFDLLTVVSLGANSPARIAVVDAYVSLPSSSIADVEDTESPVTSADAATDADILADAVADVDEDGSTVEEPIADDKPSKRQKNRKAA